MTFDHRGVRNATSLLLASMGQDISRPGLIDTPKRVSRAWAELVSGYQTNVETLLKQFDEDQLEEYSEFIVCRDIQFMSICEHHLLPFIGTAHVGYVPTPGKVIGLSKLARLVEAFSRRLQVQERLTSEIASSLIQYGNVVASACVISSNHTCMCGRGVRKPGASMVTMKFSNSSIIWWDDIKKDRFLKACGV